MNDTIKLVQEIPEQEVTDDGIESQTVEKTDDEAQ